MMNTSVNAKIFMQEKTVKLVSWKSFYTDDKVFQINDTAKLCCVVLSRL